MTKALIKKQLREMLSLFIRKDSKKKKSLGSMILYPLILCYCVVVFFGLFYSIMSDLCPALLSVNMGWLYFAFAAMISTVLAIVGSVFMAQSQLYNAKDNEFLLALPISPSKILFSRMISLYIQNFFFGALVFIPTLVVYIKQVGQISLSVIFSVLILFLLPLLSLTITCILGWVVALISSHLRNKSLFTIIFSLAFFVVYFYFFSQINQNIQKIIANSREIGEQVKGALYPFYQMGLGALGDVKGFVIFAVIVLALFILVYTILSISFIKIATTRRGEKRIRYKEKTLKVSSENNALFRKEATHFWKSPIYLLNCGLGTVFIIILAAFLIIKRGMVLEILAAIPESGQYAAILGCAVICVTASMNVITAPSVSLEGRSLWIIQSLPVTGWQILFSKLKLHMIVTAPMAALCGVVMAFIFTPSPMMSVMIVITPVVFIWLCGILGLIFNLKFPKLDWNSEAVAVKQSLSVIISMFSGWGILAAFIIVYVFFNEYIGPELYISICFLIMVMAGIALMYWIKKRGVKIIETL